VGDLSVMDSGDESVSDGLDGLIEVCLGSKYVEGCLWGERGVCRDNGSGDWVEWDR